MGIIVSTELIVKSTTRQLQHRGMLTEEQERSFKEVPYTQLLAWLAAKEPVKRTFAARQLGKLLNPQDIEPLCLALEKEKALYCKLEICNTLVLFGQNAIPNLIQRLGAIGRNQHKTPSPKTFKKSSYPLPRDIAARTLIRIGSVALPALCIALMSEDIAKVSEAVDAIGYICFYDSQEHKEVANLLQQCYHKYADNNLIRWKLIRAMSASPELFSLLEQQHMQLEGKELKQEAERSIEIINNKPMSKFNNIIDIYSSEGFYTTSRMSEKVWKNREYAKNYLQKYWLPDDEYEEQWLPIQNAIFIEHTEGLPYPIFNKEYEILAFRGGVVLTEEELNLLQLFFYSFLNEKDYFIIAENPLSVRPNEVPIRMKYPINITWGELMSGSFMSSVLFEWPAKEYFIFTKSTVWGKYSANDYINPLDIVGIKPTAKHLFNDCFYQLNREWEDFKDRIPESYRENVSNEKYF